jgi:alpha-tubulin suppressor-like RCC1 family protein
VIVAVMLSGCSLYTWGGNSVGQRGDGTTVARSVPTPVGTAASDWESVAVAGNAFIDVTPPILPFFETGHSCGIRTSGTLWCWGSNYFGQLGVGFLDGVREKSLPTRVGTNADWVSVSAGGSHTCGIRAVLRLWCWGRNSAGQLGDGTTTDNFPVRVAGAWRSVALGGSEFLEAVGDTSAYSCGIQTSGLLWCWGDNDDGQLGDGTTVERHSPVPIGAQTDWQSVALGRAHTCGIRSPGTLWCWGDNSRGQLGDGTTVDSLSPVRIGTESDWQSVESGALHTCGIRSPGTLWCWGRNLYGQLGDGTTLDRLSPVQVGTESDWQSVASGEGHSCGIRGAGTLWCWGLNFSGQLGDGTTLDRSSPVQVGTDSDWRRITAGYHHTCGVRASRTLGCWGGNEGGQVGDGTTVDRSSPAAVGTATEWQRVAAGGRHTCGIRLAGTLWCWGSNGGGEVGDGTTVDRLVPTQVGSDADWSSVASGGAHTCGIRRSPTFLKLQCWGENDFGQVGDGTTVDRAVPTPAFVQEFIPWLSVAAGGAHTCAIADPGAMWCWGNNADGQLGDGTTDDRSSPTRVGFDVAWSIVSLGESHTIALRVEF